MIVIIARAREINIGDGSMQTMLSDHFGSELLDRATTYLANVIGSEKVRAIFEETERRIKEQFQQWQFKLDKLHEQENVAEVVGQVDTFLKYATDLRDMRFRQQLSFLAKCGAWA